MFPDGILYHPDGVHPGGVHPGGVHPGGVHPGGICAVFCPSLESHLRWMFASLEFCPVASTDHMLEPRQGHEGIKNIQHVSNLKVS